MNKNNNIHFFNLSSVYISVVLYKSINKFSKLKSKKEQSESHKRFQKTESCLLTMASSSSALIQISWDSFKHLPYSPFLQASPTRRDRTLLIGSLEPKQTVRSFTTDMFSFYLCLTVLALPFQFAPRRCNGKRYFIQLLYVF